MRVCGQGATAAADAARVRGAPATGLLQVGSDSREAYPGVEEVRLEEPHELQGLEASKQEAYKREAFSTTGRRGGRPAGECTLPVPGNLQFDCRSLGHAN